MNPVPDVKVEQIVACLWDLRAQVEQQNRSLTDAHRLAAEHRSKRGPLAALQRGLTADLEGVLRVNGVVREATQDCLGLIGELPIESAADGARQNAD